MLIENLPFAIKQPKSAIYEIVIPSKLKFTRKLPFNRLNPIIIIQFIFLNFLGNQEY